MNKTLKLSFALKNTYRVNSILYSLKQIPFIKKWLPASLYHARGLKIFANIVSALWEVVSVFIGKALYLFLMVGMAASLYEEADPPGLWMHILLWLTVIGAFTNTYMFNAGRDKYYAMILMRMNARDYTIVNFYYAIGKVVIGFLLLIPLIGRSQQVPLWLSLVTPFSIAGLKMTAAACRLLSFKRTGQAKSENGLGKWAWLFIGALLLIAYGLPALGLILPLHVTAGCMIIAAVSGLWGARVIGKFTEYGPLYRQLLAQAMTQMDSAKSAAQAQSRRLISADTTIQSHKQGFEYLNELFIKRHQKILWKSSKKISGVCLCLIVGLLLAIDLKPEFQEPINSVLLTCLPYFVFIMYGINRGTGFTRVLFMNCDHSLLTYSFYKKPSMILKLFRIRLREIVKINLLPAAVIGGGLAVLLYASGGADNGLSYAILFVSIICMSIFFSVHYLVIYYLLQPYNVGTEVKSGTYQLVLSSTYFVCFFMMRLRISTPLFGCMTIVFCVLYSVIACILVYRLAPKTFRLRL